MTAMTFNQALAKIMAGEGDGAPGASERFEAKAVEIAKRDRCALHDAMRKARIEHPAEFAALQAADPVPIAKVASVSAEPVDEVARSAFVAKAHEIAERDRVPVYVAMSRTRAEHPELLAALG